MEKTEKAEKYHESLLIRRDEEIESDSKDASFFIREEIWEEVKRQAWLAGPLITVSLLQYSIQVISIMSAGHLGELSLSSASLATSFASVTGATVLNGMGSALETLCGQSYGARQYKMLGVYTQRAMLTLIAVSMPLAIIWFYTGEILILCGQDHQISEGAGTFNRWMIPTLFAIAIIYCLNRFLQTQNIVFPMLVIAGATAITHVFVCWVLIFKIGLGIKGAAMANNVSYCLNMLSLAMYVKFSPACSKTWTGFSMEAFHGLWSFLKIAASSASMVCLEYWSFEMVVLLSGLLPNPKLETSVLSISLNTCWMVYMISVGLSGAISTRVSNELGAGRPEVAKLAVKVMVIISVLEGLVVAAITILVRHIWGRLYSNEEEVVSYVAKMMFLLALSDFLDGFQCALSGAARGCGLQKLCTFINLGSYYLVAIPSAVFFSFILRIGGKGLWMGIICGLVVQNIALIIVNLCTNWENEARRALARVES